MDGDWLSVYVSSTMPPLEVSISCAPKFRVKDHPKIKAGYKSRLWCSQDAARRKKPKVSELPDVKNRDTVGMHRYDCNSSLVVTCRECASTDRIISVNLQHHDDHIPYFDVEMPSGASDIIRENLEWSTPAALVTKIQDSYPHVTGKQVHAAWTEMSETLWKRAQHQLPLAEILLKEYSDDVDVFEIPTAGGVEQLCWGMKRVSSRLKGMVVEIGIDATCAYSYLQR